MPHDHEPLTVLPSSIDACLAQIAAVRDEIRSIRIQLATTDMRRQAAGARPDADAYHRASTALRLKKRALAALRLQQRSLEHAQGQATDRRAAFTNTLIEVLRCDYDDEAWQQALARARGLLKATPQSACEVHHG